MIFAGPGNDLSRPRGAPWHDPLRVRYICATAARFRCRTKIHRTSILCTHCEPLAEICDET
jgi:hypothetical protein